MPAVPQRRGMAVGWLQSRLSKAPRHPAARHLRPAPGRLLTKRAPDAASYIRGDHSDTEIVMKEHASIALTGTARRHFRGVGSSLLRTANRAFMTGILPTERDLADIQPVGNCSTAKLSAVAYAF